MDLRELLSTIATTYDRELGQQAPAARLLRGAGEVLERYVPLGYLVKGSSGQSTTAFVPWIAVFDPDETDSATHGMYVVYLFAADMRSVSLTLLQGSEDLRKVIKGDALGDLAGQAGAIRRAMDPNLITDLDERVTLVAPKRVQRPKYYEAGTIIAKRYEIADLPADQRLADDLLRFLRLCEHGIDCRRQLALSDPGAIATGERYQPPAAEGFKSKDDSEHEQTIAARKIIKSRKHETLVNTFNDHLRDRGFTTASPHPRDLTATRDGQDWLIEAKVLRRGDAVQATRGALAQLYWYRHVHYTEPRTVRLLALFNEPVGDLCLDVLHANDVQAVWAEQGTWAGTATALTDGLC
ncbi:hypothetical protein CFP71_29930 [Amycolatopsis thailandensis]|uniref:Type IV methyl-directed restriction enzyme EcoKMcrB subunit DNA-binding domain-containing protein n=1 Tax=Amycolatopsis thailandensis TaxID=589330 RepID=A0A229RSD3_9PSEU|nr:DUF3578 domain-containing protein [Amycolatopsis thailandensis]OXM49566.1 hypothetical protein CFP71_29930 [Amycolatopsis thailandensis]